MRWGNVRGKKRNTEFISKGGTALRFIKSISYREGKGLAKIVNHNHKSSYSYHPVLHGPNHNPVKKPSEGTSHFPGAQEKEVGG